MVDSDGTNCVYMVRYYSMMKSCSILLCLLLLCVPARFVFPQNGESPVLNEQAPRGAGETAIHGLIGAGETMLTNGIIMFFNIVVRNEPWSKPTAESIRRNFSDAWEWEPTDGFKVNQIGHPIQGSVYFNTGRVNGFGFYESVFFSALGSSAWETFCEYNLASINDFITTSTSSLSMGEIFYRLYLEACAAGVPAPLAALFNPAAGVHQLITGWKPPDNGRNLNRFQVYLGAGYAQTNSVISSGNREMFAFQGFSGEAGFSTVYGNPFEQNSVTPFDHFEFAMSIGLDFDNYLNLRLISDGYLFSFSPVDTAADMMSTGLSLHLDFVSLGKYDMYDGTIDQYSNALDWTIKYQHLFLKDALFQAKFHAGITFFGVSEYYSPNKEKDLKNYGGGVNSKLLLTLEDKKLGRLEASVFGYILWSYPQTSALSEGTVYWLFADATYSRCITKHLSAGVTDYFAMERGIFSGFPNTRKYNNAVKLFVAWDL